MMRFTVSFSRQCDVLPNRCQTNAPTVTRAKMRWNTKKASNNHFRIKNNDKTNIEAMVERSYLKQLAANKIVIN